MQKIEGAAVDYFRVFEGVSPPPILHGDRLIDLHHFLNFCEGVGRAAKALVGNRQEKVGVIKFGLPQSIHRLSESLQYQICPAPAVVVEPTQCRIPRRNLVSPLKRQIRSASLHLYHHQRRKHERVIRRQSDRPARRRERPIKVALTNQHVAYQPVGKPSHLEREVLVGKNLPSEFACFSNIVRWIITNEVDGTSDMVTSSTSPSNSVLNSLR